MIVIPINKENEAKGTVVKEDVKFERKSTPESSSEYTILRALVRSRLLMLSVYRIRKSDQASVRATCMNAVRGLYGLRWHTWRCSSGTEKAMVLANSNTVLSCSWLSQFILTISYHEVLGTVRLPCELTPNCLGQSCNHSTYCPKSLPLLYPRLIRLISRPSHSPPN